MNQIETFRLITYIERKCIDVQAPKRRYIYIVKRGGEIIKTFKSKRDAFDFASCYDAWDLTLKGL